MNIQFSGKYKSLDSFSWTEIPNFVVLTGPNGSGKSQLLDLIYKSIIKDSSISDKAIIHNFELQPEEVTYIRGQWQLNDTVGTDLLSVQQQLNNEYSNFIGGWHKNQNSYSENDVKKSRAYQSVVDKVGKENHRTITKEEFITNFPEIIIERESQITQTLEYLFFDYRISQIELKADGFSDEQIEKKIGQKPWIILEEIIKESKLPFKLNNPSEKRIKETFTLTLTNSITDETIKFTDLSSGEKVLLSTVFYLYNSQEKNIFPKVLLLDEPDAHLHPSMSQQFLNVIKNVLVDKFNVRVIMTTHSPSTVVLAPYDSIYEMSKEEPRIRKSPSKNHSVSLLTAGLVYVGEGTRYFLVEDTDDVDFYTYVYSQLILLNKIDSTIPLVFIPASTKNNTGGKSIVTDWVKKLEESGLYGIVHGLIDADSGNAISGGVYKINRYSIENYFIDPVLVLAVLIDIERTPAIEGIVLKVGEEYKLKFLAQDQLQTIADYINQQIESKISTALFPDFVDSEKNKIEVEFTNGVKLLYPEWLLNRRGKTLMSLYTTTFSSNVNFASLNKAMRKLNVFPFDLVDKFKEIKDI